MNIKKLVIETLDLNNIENPETLNYKVVTIDKYNRNAELQVSVGDMNYVILHSCKDRFKSRQTYSSDGPEVPETEIKLNAILDYINALNK